MAFTYKNPAALHRSAGRARRRTRDRGRRSLLSHRRDGSDFHASHGRRGEVRASAITTSSSARGCAPLRPSSRPRDSRPGWWPTTTRSSTARPRTAPASAGSARTPTSCCRVRARGSCSGRSSPTLLCERTRFRSTTAAGRAVVASTGARRVRSSPRASSTPVGALPGSCSRRACSRATPSGARRPPLRMRRLPGGVPAEPSVGGPTRSTSPTDARVGSTCSICSQPPTTTLLERHGRWYIPDRAVRYLRRNALIVLGNTADGDDPEVELTLRTYLSHDDELAPRARALGRRPPRTARSPRAGRRRRRARWCTPSCEAPARHERLPAEARWDPGLPLGAVAAASAR